jgi:uracil-DNA glycosylase
MLKDPLSALKHQARDCRRCPLWQDTTQTVFGAGSARAKIMLVGEQPGDKEDIAGKPFVGPAGQLLEKTIAQLGLSREDIYLTNAVKHFKHELRGKRRMHKTPAQREIEICRQWLLDEIAIIKPSLIVALGATATKALFNRALPILINRGKFLKTEDGLSILITVHPSSILRAPGEDRQAAYELFLHDLSAINNI